MRASNGSHTLILSLASIVWTVASSVTSASVSSVGSGQAHALSTGFLRSRSWKGKHTAAVASHRTIKEAQALRSRVRRDSPGGPREAPWPLLFKPQTPFTYVNIKGWDDQWHSMDPAAPELKMPAGVQQIPNPSNFTLVPIVVAPHDRWPNSGQTSAHDISGEVTKYATTSGNRFGPGWFLKNHRPVVAPMDSVPQNFQTYFNGFVKNGKMMVPTSPPTKSLVSVKMKQVDDSVARAEAAASHVANIAYRIESKTSRRDGNEFKAAWLGKGAHGDVQDSMAVAEAALAASDAGLSDASTASDDLVESQQLLAAAEKKPRLVHFTP